MQQIQQQGRNQQRHQVVGETIGIKRLAQGGIILLSCRIVGPHIHKERAGFILDPMLQRFDFGSIAFLLAQQRGQRQVVERLVASVALRGQSLVGPTGFHIAAPTVILGRRDPGNQFVGHAVGKHIGRHHQVVVDTFALRVFHSVEHVLYHILVRHLHLVEFVTADPILQFVHQNGQLAKGILQTALGQQSIYFVSLFFNLGRNHLFYSKSVVKLRSFLQYNKLNLQIVCREKSFSYCPYLAAHTRMLEYTFLLKESYLQNLNLSKFVSTMALHYLCRR